MNRISPAPFDVRNGWSLYSYSAFTEAFQRLSDAVAQLKAQHPETYERHPKTKILSRVLEVILNEIPRDPNAAEYQLGNTLGSAHRHWRRAKFLGRFRLFYRFSSTLKAIVYVWVNDQASLRKADSRTDPYAIFLKRLRNGDPPEDWEDLFRMVKPGD